MKALTWLASLLFYFIASTLAYQPSSSSRRIFLEAAAGIVSGASLFPPSDAQAVISKQLCASGQGEGCNDLAEGNEFIKSLQQKSAENAEVYARDARNAYYQKNYPDVFAVDNKSMVRKPDGSFMLVSDRELKRLKADSKIDIEIPRTMGGKIVDVTQKPVLILKE